MAIIEKIIELNKAGKPVVWPSSTKCSRCGESIPAPYLHINGLCDCCYEDVKSFKLS